MRTATRLCLLMSLALPVANCSLVQEAARPVAPGQFRLIRLPVLILGQEAPGPAEARLTLSIGTDDELPQGPQGFEVLPDESIVVTDPLAHRLAIFDGQGDFLRAFDIGFAADSVRFEDSLLLIRRAFTGEEYSLDLTGNLPPQLRGRARDLAGGDRALMVEPGVGEITPSSARGLEQASFPVRMNGDENPLISLRYLGSDKNGFHYVALETAEVGDAVEVAKRLRKYGPNGELIAEAPDIPNDYFVSPVDEFRLHGQSVFHLVPLRNEVRIEIWETGDER